MSVTAEVIVRTNGDTVRSVEIDACSSQRMATYHELLGAEINCLMQSGFTIEIKLVTSCHCRLRVTDRHGFQWTTEVMLVVHNQPVLQEAHHA